MIGRPTSGHSVSIETLRPERHAPGPQPRPDVVVYEQWAAHTPNHARRDLAQFFLACAAQIVAFQLTSLSAPSATAL